MNIIDQAKAFVQSLHELASRPEWYWRRCPHCESTITCKYGKYQRRAWFFEGRREVQVQRHRCGSCGRTYSEQSALLVAGSWYAREVHRLAIDQWQHSGTSLRRAAEWIRSLLGKQERWLLWRVLEPRCAGRERCYLAASTVQRWLNRAGVEAERTVPGQLSGVAISRQMGADGLWARLRGGVQRVALAVVDCVSGVVWPVAVVEGEEKAEGWGQLFQRAQEAGLKLRALRGLTSDGSHGLLAYLRGNMGWVNHQRCVWHLWRSLAELLKAQARAATEGLSEAMAASMRRQVRRELSSLMRGVFNAASYEQAEAVLAQLEAHAWGEKLARAIRVNLDAALMHLQRYNQGLSRVAPEYLWRDFRLRLSRGRNHGSEQRLQRAMLVWAVYRNFTPAQWRSEHKRHYRRPGQSPLTQAGVQIGELSYLDALRV